VGVVQGDAAVLFCAPTLPTCERMERKLLESGDYERFATCAMVEE
jgi:hypothetical protein